jgi:hypothetical protein
MSRSLTRPWNPARPNRLIHYFVLACFSSVAASSASAQSGIALLQHAGKDAGLTVSSSLSFATANSSGNWIAVCIRAGRAGEVLTVTDSNGNAYRRAVQFNVTSDVPNGDTLGIFYAENIKGGPNTVSVADTISATLRFAIFEYSGVATTNSLDAVASSQGVGSLANSGTVATTSSGDLLLGAIITGNPDGFGAGSGYAIEESVPVPPNTKLIAEDAIQASSGAASAGASLSASQAWGASMAAFRSLASGTPSVSPPFIASLSPVSGGAGTPVTINGANFGASQGSSTVSFNGLAAVPSSWTATTIVAPVPSGATTGNVVVTVGGLTSNAVSFVTGPISVSVTPAAPTLNPNSSQQFNAAVQFDSRNLGVSWTLSGPGCSGTSCGALSSATATSVIYTAPNVPPNPPNVNLTATSISDATKLATANIAIALPSPISVSISPSSRTVSVNLSQPFTASVTNDPSGQGVTWALTGTGCSGASCGTLSAITATSVTFVAPPSVPAPATVTLTATSVADSTKSASAVLTISQGIPTTLGWYQLPNTWLQPECPAITQIQGAIGCQGVISAWSGGIADTARNRLLFTGGGHQNYWGNEVYSLNLNDLTLTRINDPVFPSSSIPSCSEDWGTLAGQRPAPAARETYSGLAYISDLDELWLFGGALGTSGCRSTGMWTLDLPTLTWARMDPTNGVQETVYTDINYADYDPVTKLVYVYIANNDVLASYDPHTNTVTELLNHNSYGTPAYANGVLDPKRRLFFIIGAGFAGSYDLSKSPPQFTRLSSLTSGCAGLQNMNYPGLAYDPVQDKIVGWAGGNTVYLFDSSTFTCTAVTYPGGPPAQQANGTYGRWRYFPALNLFALVNDWKQNAFTLRLTPAP